MNDVARLISRVDETLEQSSGRFPVYADAQTGEWTWSGDGGWSGGFWIGLLWLSAVATGQRRYVDAATTTAARLRARLAAPTVLRGFLFWYGAALGVELGLGDQDESDMATGAARSMTATFDPIAGVLPPDSEDSSEYEWSRPGACIDSLPGTVPLLSFAANRAHDPSLSHVATSHARGLTDMCVRPDGSIAQFARYDGSGHLVGRTSINGSSKDSTWARAQAWAMLGLSQAAHRWPEFTPVALESADWYLSHAPEDGVTYWDFDDPAIPDAPRDTSAAAIAAAALVKLARLGGDRYRRAAHEIVDVLRFEHLNQHGGLVDGCYSQRNGLATSNELIWGDYFMLEASLDLAGALDNSRL